MGQLGHWLWAEGARWRLVISLLLWEVIVNGRLGLASEMVVPNLQKGDPKLVDAEGVDDGVHGRVAVREEDGDVDEDAGLLAGGAEEGDAVQDVQWQPAEGEEEEDERQRLGDLQLLPVVLLGVTGGGGYFFVELLTDQVEHLQVDEDHEKQRRQHPDEEVEVDHVLHADNLLELTLDHGLPHTPISCPGLLHLTQIVPAEHGCQADHKGENPAACYGHCRPPLGHHCLVPGGKENRV